MKRIVALLFLINLVFGLNVDKYLNYSNQFFNYQFELKGFNKIKEPFEPNFNIINGKKIKNVKTLIRTIKIDLLSIFDKRAYLKIREYLGEQLTKVYRKWVKKGDTIGNCKVSTITIDKVIFKCKNKELIKTLYKKIPNIKEQQ